MKIGATKKNFEIRLDSTNIECLKMTQMQVSKESIQPQQLLC